MGWSSAPDNQVKLRRQYRQTCNVADFYEYLGLVEKGEPLILTITGGESLEIAPVAAEELGGTDLVQMGASLSQPATAGPGPELSGLSTE